MISHLKGVVQKLGPGEADIEVGGVGYRVSVPQDAWDLLAEGTQQTLWISTYVREDRFDLFGFPDSKTRTLFEKLIGLPGIGPKLGLELCAVPRSLFLQAIASNESELLTSIKGIGKKTAEKLLLELKSLMERNPDILATNNEKPEMGNVLHDRDAIAALTQLGYSMPEILRKLQSLPVSLRSTEERVTAALRSS